jgi:hypothetical protein
VSDHEFFFALEMSDEPEFDRMFGELAWVVLGYAGYEPPAIAETAGVLRAALADRAAAGHQRCGVRFRAHGGELEIIVSCAGRAEWRTTRPLPTP